MKKAGKKAANNREIIPKKIVPTSQSLKETHKMRKHSSEMRKILINAY